VKIAIVAPVEESIPPWGYGGIEQVVHRLDCELAARGHEVVLLASGGSSAAGRLVPLVPEPLAVPDSHRDVESFVVAKDHAARRAAEVLRAEQPDVVLNHMWRLLDHLPGPDVGAVFTTVHYPLDADPYRSIFLARSNRQYVSVSRSQRTAAPQLSFVGTVPNGIDVDALPFTDQSDEHLVFLGRMSPDKGLDLAIVAAQRAGLPLRVGAKLDAGHRPWFDEVIRPLLRRGGVELMGELATGDKAAFLGGARGLLHPSRWSEPFGMVAVEAMACGTPVVMLRRGAADEVVVDGTTGFVVDHESELPGAIERLTTIDRRACRVHVTTRFDGSRMADGYERLITGRSGS
jgi:glycosyltransferase involved in cell wall biosynthesis